MEFYNVYIVNDDGTRKLYGVHEDLMEAVSVVEYLEQMSTATFEIVHERNDKLSDYIGAL